MGADVSGKQELDPVLVTSADLLVCDCRKQTLERGEFQTVGAQDLIDKDNILELGEVLTGEEHKRKDSKDTRLTIFDSSGLAIQDVMISKMVYQAVQKAS